MTKKNTLGKNERLKSRKSIDQLFDGGRSFAIYPFRVYYQVVTKKERPPTRVAVSVSKKIFKKAVDRNRVKRQMREAYRLQKHALHDHLAKTTEKALDIFLIYVGKDFPEYQHLSTVLGTVLARIIKEIK